jgi:hypothetical protein
VPLGRVGDETLGLEPHSFVSPLDHRLRSSHLVIGSGRCGFHIDDDRVLYVDQVIEPFEKSAS